MQAAFFNNEDAQQERQRLMVAAHKGSSDLVQTINNMEWCTSYEKNGIKSWVAPRVEHDKEFRVMGTVTIRRPPLNVFSFIMDNKNRPAWDKLLNEHKIVDEFSRDANHRTLLWTMKFRPRYLKFKRRVTVFACYAGVHPHDTDGGYMLSMTSVTTPMAPVAEDEIPFLVPITGYIVSKIPDDPTSSVLTYVLRVTIQRQHLGFMERSLMRTISQWAPPHVILDRLGTLRSLIEERSMVSVASTFPCARESNLPPQFLRDFSYIKTDPIQNRDELIRFYCGADKQDLWQHVATERGLVMQKFRGQLMHERHNLALKLTFSTFNFIQFSRCLSDVDKRLIWEPCATRVEHIWDDGPMNVCLKVVGGGPAKGRGCPKFEVFVYHIYSYGIYGDKDEVDSCVYEEHSDGNILLVMLTCSLPNSSIDVYFFTNTSGYMERSRTSQTFLPTTPLAPIERTLLESVIEFRNVVELDTWIPTESIEKLSLSDLAKSVSPTHSVELPAVPASVPAPQKQKRKQAPQEGEAEPTPFFGKVRSYFNRLPSFSSVFGTQQPTPPPPTRPEPSSLHLLFKSPPSNYMNDLINQLPYEILLHIMKYFTVDEVRPCSQICHRAWQATNCDVIWRDLIADLRDKRYIEVWDKYENTPSNSIQATTTTTATTTMTTSTTNTSTIFHVLNPDEGESVDQRRTLTSLLTSIEGLASPFKLEYLQGIATEKCWKYGVSSYVHCGALGDDEVVSVSEYEHEDTILLASKSGTVRGIHAANTTSSTRLAFSIQASQRPALQAQWRGDKVIAIFDDGEVLEYTPSTKEQKIQRLFTPMAGGFLYHNPSTAASPPLIVTHVRDKLMVRNMDDRNLLLKWRSSRGDISKVRVSATRCMAVTSMHALHTVNVLDMSEMADNKLLSCLSGHQDSITDVRLLDYEGNLVASSSKDGTVRVWDMRVRNQALPKQYIHAAGEAVNCFYATPDKLVAGLSSGDIAYWDPRNASKPVMYFSIPTTHRRDVMSIC